MQTITADTLGECWLECIQCILEDGLSHHDEDVGIREVLGLSMSITYPSSQDRFIAGVGDKQVIEKMLKKFSKGTVMPDRPFTYGQLIYDMNGVDQFDWMVERLQRKPETKSATISLLTPGSNDSNLPCLSVLDAKIRNNELHLQFFFRSQNVFGRQYANLLAMAQLHERLASRTGSRVGSMRGTIASAHIYEYDLADACKLVTTHELQIEDHYYNKGPASIRSV